MNLVAVPANAIRLGVPLPVPLRDHAGRLLLARGAVVESEAARQQLVARGLYVEETDSERYLRALAGTLDTMVRQNALLGALARATPALTAPAAPLERDPDPLARWSDLQLHAAALLREAPRAGFAARLARLDDALLLEVDQHPDEALLVLVQRAIAEPRGYSATHALLVAVVCELAVRHLAAWPTSWRQPLRLAALTMNLGMTALQDQLALQAEPPTAPQRAQIAHHPEHGVALLQQAGVDDVMWLQALAHHHDAPAGPLSSLPPGLQLARLVQRADIYAARLSPRASRKALSATAAVQAAYLDEQERADEAGAAIVKATGLYPPGSHVRLASGEAAVVLRRGPRVNEPVVAAVVGKDGLPLGEPVLRDTGRPSHAVAGSLAPHEVKLRLNLERLLKLL